MLGLACAAQFMVVLDVSVVNVAVPSIQRAFGFDQADLQWVASAYALVFAGFLLLGGRLADLYGRRQAFVGGLALFSVASLAGGLASTQGMLIAARAAQGLGAAVLAPATLTVLTATFAEGPRRTRALATWTAMSLAGGAAGNLIGGVITQYLSWRWILLINVPIGAVAIVLAARFLTGEHRRGQRGRVDVPGAVLATTSLAALTYGLTQTGTSGWNNPVTLVAVPLGLLALAAFVMIETRFASAPLLPTRLLRIRAVALGNVLMLLTAAGFQIPMWYFLTLYMQNVLHYGALQAGAGFLPHTVLTLVIGLRVTPWLMKHVHSRALISVGALIAGMGFVWQSGISPSSAYLSGILGPAVLISVGGGLLNTPLTTTVTSDVSKTDAGAASGLMNTTKQIGGVLGLAVLLTIAGSHTNTSETLTMGYSHAFLAVAVVLTVVSALALMLPTRRDLSMEPATEPDGRATESQK